MSTKWMWVIVSIVGALLLVLPPPWMGAARALDALVAAKPERHRFDISAVSPAVERHMSVTGG